MSRMSLLACTDRTPPAALDSQPNTLSSVRRLKECMQDMSQHVQAWYRRLFTLKLDDYTRLCQKENDVDLPSTGDLVSVSNLNHKPNNFGLGLVVHEAPSSDDTTRIFVVEVVKPVSSLDERLAAPY